MNTADLGLKERLGVKFKNGMCIEFCLKFGFESDHLEAKFQATTF